MMLGIAGILTIGGVAFVIMSPVSAEKCPIAKTVTGFAELLRHLDILHMPESAVRRSSVHTK